MCQVYYCPNLQTNPIVGEKYLVPFLEYEHYRESVSIPIILNLHKDVELGVTYNHYHADPRFMTNYKLKNSMKRDSNYPYLIEQARLVRIFNIDEIGQHKIVIKEAICRREMPTFPEVPKDYVASTKIFSKFEKAFIGKKVKCGKCPHRQFQVDNLPIDKDGFAICNGHGLKIDTKRQQIVKR